MEILYCFLALVFAAVIVYTFLKPTKTRPPLPPGPPGYPVIGCLPQIVKNKPTFRWMNKIMTEMNTEIACFPIGNTYVIPVTSPELAREFLKKQDAVFASRPDCMSARIISSSYLATALSPLGDQWKKMRRVLVSEVLSPAMHRRLHEKRSQEADHLVRYVYNQTNGLVNVRVAAQHFCGNVIRKLVFGKRFFGPGAEDGGPGVEEREHLDGCFSLLSHLYAFAIGDYIPWLEIFDFDGYKKILTNAMKHVSKYQDPEINQRVEMWQNGMRHGEEDILDVLINLKDSQNNHMLSIQEIKSQVLDITLAGVDNPSNAVEWAMAEMVSQPKILGRACLELDRVVGRGRFVQESDLPSLNYLKACLKESLRLHPVASFNVPHVSTKDTTVGGYFIPKGTHVLLSRPGLGRNPKTWENPLMYEPERHLIHRVDGDATSSSDQVALVDPDLRMLSFSTGRRGCTGVVLGSTMVTMLLARLVQGFNWQAEPPHRVELVESESNMQLATPLILHATPRLAPEIYDLPDSSS